MVDRRGLERRADVDGADEEGSTGGGLERRADVEGPT